MSGRWKIDPHLTKIQVGPAELGHWLGQVGFSGLVSLDYKLGQICRFSWVKFFWAFLAKIIGLSKLQGFKSFLILSYQIGPPFYFISFKMASSA